MDAENRSELKMLNKEFRDNWGANSWLIYRGQSHMATYQRESILGTGRTDNQIPDVEHAHWTVSHVTAEELDSQDRSCDGWFRNMGFIREMGCVFKHIFTRPHFHVKYIFTINLKSGDAPNVVYERQQGLASWMIKQLVTTRPSRYILRMQDTINICPNRSGKTLGPRVHSFLGCSTGWNTAIPSELYQDLYGFDTIDNDTFIIMINRDNPWRQILGHKLHESGARPIIIVCVPVHEECEDDSLDEKSDLLAEIVDEGYKEYPWVWHGGYNCAIKTMVDSHPAVRVTVFNKISIYFRKPSKP